MSHHRLGEEVDHASHCAALGVGRSVDEARDPRQRDGAGAHRARLERHVDRRLQQTPASQSLRGLAQSEHLGVRGGIAAKLTLIARLPEHLLPSGHDGPDRDVAVLGRPRGEPEGEAHHSLIGFQG